MDLRFTLGKLSICLLILYYEYTLKKKKNYKFFTPSTRPLSIREAPARGGRSGALSPTLAMSVGKVQLAVGDTFKPTAPLTVLHCHHYAIYNAQYTEYNANRPSFISHAVSLFLCKVPTLLLTKNSGLLQDFPGLFRIAMRKFSAFFRNPRMFKYNEINNIFTTCKVQSIADTSV